jgi:hypothetical protein
MASMARSGETLLLKILACHDKVKVVHNLDAKDDLKKEKTFETLKNYQKDKVFRLNALFNHYELKKGDVLLLKQGVWEHKYPFNGFVLARNPISIYSSLKVYDRNLEQYDADTNFWFNNNERLIRWSKSMNEELMSELMNAPPFEQFVKFYNYRMGYLFKLNIPIIRFEDLVNETKETLIKVCEILGVEFQPKLMESHNFYGEGLIGHGQNDLSKPINKDVLEKYKCNINIEEFEYIADNTKEVSSKYGYSFEKGEIILL